MNSYLLLPVLPDAKPASLPASPVAATNDTELVLALDPVATVAVATAAPLFIEIASALPETTLNDIAKEDVKEEVRTRWSSDELEKIGLRMVELQAANPSLGDLEAVRLAQMVLERQRVINQWQNAKRLDPILARLRGELALGTLNFNGTAEAVPSPFIADQLSPALADSFTVAVIANLDESATSTGFTAPTVPTASVADKPTDESLDSIVAPGLGHESMATPVALDAPVALTVVLVNASAQPSESTGLTGEESNAANGVSSEIQQDIIEAPPAAPPAVIAELVSTSLPDCADPLKAVDTKVVIEQSLPTAGDIHLTLVAALGALVAPDMLSNVLRSLKIEEPLKSLSHALEKAFANDRAGVLSQELDAVVAADTKIFVAGFSDNEKKLIETALGCYDLRLWKPSQGPQAFKSMAKACTIAVISEAMSDEGDDVNELLRSLNIRIVQHQGSTSRLAERIAEMVSTTPV